MRSRLGPVTDPYVPIVPGPPEPRLSDLMPAPQPVAPRAPALTDQAYNREIRKQVLIGLAVGVVAMVGIAIYVVFAYAFR